MTYSRYRLRDRGSRSVALIEQAWVELKGIEPRLPHVVVTLVNSPRRGLLGYVHPQQWRYVPGKSHKAEVAISPGLLNSPASALAVLVHEAAHALFLDMEPFLGCGPDGYYHRKEFRDVARRLGLKCEFRNNRYGWCNTGWPRSSIPVIYETTLAILADLPTGTGNDLVREPKPKPLPRSGHVRLACRCGGKRSIYVVASVRRRGGIICRFCRCEFQPR
jgi:hypothetical protein